MSNENKNIPDSKSQQPLPPINQQETKTQDIQLGFDDIPVMLYNGFNEILTKLNSIGEDIKTIKELKEKENKDSEDDDD